MKKASRMQNTRSLFQTVAMAFLGLAVVFLFIRQQVLVERSHFSGFCLDMHRFNGLVPPADRLDPEPFAVGYFHVDVAQTVISWRLVDGLHVHPRELNVYGPVDRADPERPAPLFRALGVGKDARRRYAGSIEVGAEDAALLRRHAADYYVAFVDASGREFVTDALKRECPWSE